MRMIRSVSWAGVLALVLVPGAYAADPNKAELANKALDILKVNCHRCHGQEGTVEGGMNFVLDLKALVSRKKVIPGDPAKSKLFNRISSEVNPMPPEDEKVRPSKEDIATLKRWIEAGGPDPATAPPPRRTISETDIIRFISDDLEKTDEADRRFVRYFSIAHLSNAGLSEDELLTYRHGLSKLVNSLSWGRKIVVPKPIDPGRTILRIDLRDYKWSSQVWTRITGIYVYGIYLKDATAMGVYSNLDWDFPYIRADWFVYLASRPPLYYWVLQMPGTDSELEKQLKVDVPANIDGGLVVRAAFNSSGISRHNRLIERHESPYGAYWKSYDFAAGDGKKNLFAFPFGPGDGTRDFQQDGGEIIFTLPNGLHGFMLVDGSGRRIDEGPTKIVSDPKQPDKAVVNGVSCMSCHAKGLIEKDDQVRETVAKNPAGFADSELQKVKALYPPREKFAGILRDDQARYKAAVEQTGGRMTATEPVVALASRFDVEMDLAMAANECGVAPAEFARRVRQSPQLSRILGALNIDGGTVQRKVFAKQFNEIVREMNLGIPRIIRNSIEMRLAYVPAGEFWMGSSEEDEAARANERPRHLVRITKPFYMGQFTVTQQEFDRVMGKSPSRFGPQWGGQPTNPAESMSWVDAKIFCKTLSEREEEKRLRRRYRLPTEAEWEYACRAGTTTNFNFGDTASLLHANWGDHWGRPTPGGAFAANRFGLYDMHGNLFQFCQDWYDKDYYASSPVNDPQGPPISRSRLRVIRGGSFTNESALMRSASRTGVPADDLMYNTSFRVVCDITE